MPSAKAIEAAQREAISRNLSSAWQDPNDLYHVLTAAYAIDGDFNDGVEAAAEIADMWSRDPKDYLARKIAEIIAAEIRKLRK